MAKQFIFIVLLLGSILPLYGQTSIMKDEKPLDTLLKEQLETIRMKDQSLRLILPMVEEKFGKHAEETTFFWNLINEQDSINEVSVTKIIDEYGWLGINRVGYMANQSIWLVIQHAPVKTQQKYLNYLTESVKKGESEGWQLAFLEDRILMRTGKKQKYGTQSKYNEQTGANHIYIIADPVKVNERRKEVGLETIEEYAKKNNYIYEPLEMND